MNLLLFLFYITFINVTSAEECSVYALTSDKPDEWQNFENLDSIISKQTYYKLKFDFCDFGQFTINTLKNFTSLERLDFYKCTFENIQSGSFQELKKLKYIRLTYANVKQISATAFKEVTSLEVLLLFHVVLPTPDETIFEGLNNLRNLSIINTTQSIRPYSFVTLQNLQFLDWLNNSIQYIKKDVLPPTIQGLYLYTNQMRHLGDSVFEKLSSLERLDLSFNFLSRLGRNNFWNLKKLRRLSLNKNRLVNLNWTEFNNLESLETFNIGDNQIYFLPQNFLEASVNLENVYIYGNHLTMFDFGYFHYSHEHLLKFSITGNEWKCNNLKTLSRLAKKGVILLANDTINEPNVNGIACDNENNQVEERYNLFEESKRYEVNY